MQGLTRRFEGFQFPHYPTSYAPPILSDTLFKSVLAINAYMLESAEYTRRQLGLLRIAEIAMGQSGFKTMNKMVERTIDENVSELSSLIQSLPLGHTGLRLCVTDPERSLVAGLQGIGFSTENGNYTALVQDGFEVWPIVDPQQLSLRRVHTIGSIS